MVARRLRNLAALSVLLAALAAPAFAQQAADTVAPEARSTIKAKEPVHAAHEMVVAANPVASGSHAIDSRKLR